MASDSVNMIAQLGGETVIYTPSGGVAKTFLAVVHRRPMQVQQAGGHSYGANTIEIEFPNDATDGVTSVTERKDEVQFKRLPSDAAVTTYTVNKIVAQDEGLTDSDGGMFRVLVQA